MTIPVGTIGVKDGVMLKALIGNVSGRVTSGEVTLTLPGESAVAVKGF